MRVTFDIANAKAKRTAASNMSLDDVIKAQNAQKPNQKGQNANAKHGQGGNTNNKFQRQNPQQRQNFQRQNNPQQRQNQWNKQKQQQGFGGIQRNQGGPKPPLSAMRMPMFFTNPSGKISISNLDPGVSDADIVTLFSPFGELKEVKLYFDNEGNPLGSAHIIFENYGDAVKGMQRYNGVPLDGRPMNMYIEKLPITGERKNVSTNQQANTILGSNAKPVKRLQKSPQQQGGNINKQSGNLNQQVMNTKQVKNTKQVIVNTQVAANKPKNIIKLTKTNTQTGKPQVISLQTKKKQVLQQQQQNQQGAKLKGNIQMNYGVTKNYSFGVPAGNISLKQSTRSLTSVARPGILNRLDTTPSSASLTGMARPGVLDRLDGGQGTGSLTGMARPGVLERLDTGSQGILGAAPSILNRLDGGVQLSTAGQKKALLPNPSVLSRLGGTVTETKGASSILSRVGPKQAALVQPTSQQWSFAIPGGVPVTPKPKVNQLQKINMQQRINQQQVKQKQVFQKKLQQVQSVKRPQIQQQGLNKKKTPTAADLDAELDDYIRQNAKK